jgi:polysaccharide export outer membrane protein
MKYTIVLLLVLLLAGSCMHKKIRYIQDDNEIPGKTYNWDNTPPDYLIQQKDILYIKISSTNKDISKFFELESGQTNVSGGGMGNAYYLNGFTVNDTGYIVVPVLGELFVEGKTMKEVENIVQLKTDEHLQHAISTVRMVSFNITFLGEVSRQGKFPIMQDNVNILDAIALAGGITDYGNRKNILIVRQTETGAKTFRIDLTDRKILSSENYYLVPNDIIVVEPLKNKSFALGVRDYTLILTTITSTITMILLVVTLFKP